MLGLLLIYFIGKKFYELAGIHHKNQWGYAVLGVISYYLGTFIAGIVLIICMELFGTSSIEDVNEFVLSLVALPFGLLTCWGVYVLLEKNWTKERIDDNPDILDIDLVKEEMD
jgi:hypothetical protein